MLSFCQDRRSGFKVTGCWIGVCWWLWLFLIAMKLDGRASVVIRETFDYGAEPGWLAGFNGGMGFSDGWMDADGMGAQGYVPTGLTFGSLVCAGGAAQVFGVSNAAPYLKTEAVRPINIGSNVSGTLYGAYLFSIPYISGSGNDSLAVLFGGTNIASTGIGGSPDNLAQLDVSSLYYKGSGRGNVRLTGTAGTSAGLAITAGTTYLALWQADGLVASGSGAQKLSLWILTAAQFSFFKTNGLVSAKLNAATLGTASNNIIERASLNGTYPATFLTNSLIALYSTFYASNTPIGMTVDEIRIGTGSLDEVTPVVAVPFGPQIFASPPSQTAYIGTAVQLSVGAMGYPVLSYQWKRGAIGTGAYTDVVDGPSISGAASAKLTIANVNDVDAADYIVVVTNAAGYATSSPPATLTVTALRPPQITASPSSQTVQGGTPAVKLIVAATGEALSYQWLVRAAGGGNYQPVTNAGNISGATAATLSVMKSSAADAGDYVVIVANAAGVVTSAPPATLSFYYATNSVPDWGLGPFFRPEGVNPVIFPNVNAIFADPILGQPVNWESTHTFNPAAVRMGSNICVLYRSEDNSGSGIGTFCSRDGLAISADGLHFTCAPAPALYPGLDAQKANEWPGGCEDPRLVQAADGTYVALYTQWNRSLARLGVATSTNLTDWTKYGSPFAMFGNASVNAGTGSKSAGILTALVGGQLRAVKHLGQYWMYWGEGSVKVATSDDLINWRPNGPGVLSTRSGKFDSSLVEGGPPAVLTPKGIVVFYNGKNANPGDTNLSAGAYAGGQALFDAKEPTKLVGRTDRPFFQPEAPFEVTGQYAAGTTFIEGLVPFQNHWFLYYGAADTYVGVAMCEQTNFAVSGPWLTNSYYQGFDGLNMGATNSLDGATLLSTAPGTVAGVQDFFQKELQLITNGVPNVTSAFVLPDVAAGRAIYGFSARWNAEFYYTNLPACGLSFNLSRVADRQILSLPAENGYGDGLSIVINNDLAGAPGFYLRVNGVIVTARNFNPDTQWGKTNIYRNFFAVDWNYTNGLTFTVNGTVIFTNALTSGFVPLPGQYFSWAARSSTNQGDIRIDNICLFANANLTPVQLAPPWLGSSSTTGYALSNVFDGNYGTQWRSDTNAAWIQASCANGPQMVAAYSVVSASANWQADPRNWTLTGSMDGTNWVMVDAEYLEGWGNNDSAMRRASRTFQVNQPAAYQMYRLNIATNNGAAATQVADVTLYASKVTLPQPVINSMDMNNHALISRGTGGAPLGVYYVQTATNIGQPFQQWSMVSTNQFDTAGGFSFTNALPAGTGNLFFRLALP